MKKNIRRSLQIAWLVVAMFTTHNSILTLNGDAGYCSGMSCVSDSDCDDSCRCDSLDSKCYNPGQSTF
jgi:hypothetical protein